MDTWTARVTAAAADWVYVPPDAPTVVTDEYALVGYPETFTLPTQVTRIRSSRPAADLVAEVDAAVAGWGRPDVAWRIDPATTPADLEQHLRGAGAELAETVTVLAVDLTGPLPEFSVPADVVAWVAGDDDEFRLFASLEAAAWQTTVPADDYVARWRAERLRVAREHGATMGLVKGRVTTSAPILRRLGFDVFADEHAYRRAVTV